MTFTNIEFIGSVFIFVFSLVIHENAHARVAYYLGDSTARDMGRFSFNPLKHLSLISILLPIGLYLMHAPMISFAKPVMYKQSSFKRPILDTILVALAGPFSNLILATIGFLLCNRLTVLPEALLLYINKLLVIMVFVNLILCAFNLIPIPPLDGSVIYMSTLTAKKPGIALILSYGGLTILICLAIALPLIGETQGKDYDMVSSYINWFINTFYSVLSPWLAKG